MDKQRFMRMAEDAMKDDTLMVVTISVADAWILISGIQLAMRHPKMREAVLGKMLEQIGKDFQQSVVEIHPEANELIELGWNPDFDSLNVDGKGF